MKISPLGLNGYASWKHFINFLIVTGLKYIIWLLLLFLQSFITCTPAITKLSSSCVKMSTIIP